MSTASTPTDYERRRDAKRWATFSKMLEPNSGCSESERTQAAKYLAELKARYGGPPFVQSSSTAWTSSAKDDYKNAYERSCKNAYERSCKAAEDEANRRRESFEQKLAEQAASIEAIPDWGSNAQLRKLYAAPYVWTNMESKSVDAIKATQLRLARVDILVFLHRLAKLSSDSENLTIYEYQQLKLAVKNLASGYVYEGSLAWLAGKGL